MPAVANATFIVWSNAWWDDALQLGSASDTSWDISTKSFEMNVKRTYSDASPLLQATTANGMVVTVDATQRIIQMNVTNTQLAAALPLAGRYVFDLVMIDTVTLARTPVLWGQFNYVQR